MKILVADDSPVLRAAVRKLLEPAGYEVFEAADGVAAITAFYEERPDLVLLDVQMPKLIGYVVCRLIKDDAAVAHIPVLILTARDSEEDRYWGAHSGADGYLTKDALGEGLISRVKSVLATQALSSLNTSDLPPPPSLGETDVLTRVCEMLDRKLFEATIVNELTAIGNRSLDVRATVTEVMAAARRLVPFDVGAITTVDDLVMHTHRTVAVAPEELEELVARTATSLQRFADPGVEPRHVQPLILDDVEEQVDRSAAWDSVYAVPLRVRRETIGVMILASRQGGVFGDAALRTIRTIEPAIASVVESAQRFQKALVDEAKASLSSLGG